MAVLVAWMGSTLDSLPQWTGSFSWSLLLALVRTVKTEPVLLTDALFVTGRLRLTTLLPNT